jgi:hypothetical protein
MYCGIALKMVSADWLLSGGIVGAAEDSPAVAAIASILTMGQSQQRVLHEPLWHTGSSVAP